jgi:AcrR family transcriptional regulator
MTVTNKRDHLVNVAMTLFYANGFHATGVEKIIKEAGVSKKTLYHHFTSKNELILAVLRKRDEVFRNNFKRTVEKLATDPRDQMLAIFDALGQWFDEKEFSGCLFINASAEFSDDEDPCNIVCKEHKKLICDYIQTLAEKAGSKNPKELAQKLNLLADGAIVCANVGGDKDAAKKAQEMARVFVDLSLIKIN